ncbi:MAG: ATPase domain-containing protein [Candidatus Micrarchaeota archaeon]
MKKSKRAPSAPRVPREAPQGSGAASALVSDERVKTGVPGLDQMIDGGLERNSVVLVAGEAGTGKTTLALQFLYNGITNYDEPGLYITFEEQKGMLLKHMKNFGWNFDELEKQKKIKFLSYPPHEVDKFIAEGGVVEDMIRDLGVKRVVIDSVTSLLLLYENEYKRREAFIKTIEALRKWGCTTLLTSEGEGGAQHEARARFGIEFLADGFVMIHSIRRGDVRDLALEVVKLRGINHDRKLSPLKITPKGVSIFPTQPVFGDIK